MKWKIACLVLASLSILAFTAAAQPNGAVWVGKAGKPACACECKVVLVKAGQGHCQGQCRGHCQGQCRGQCQGQCRAQFAGHGPGCPGSAGGCCSGRGPSAEFQRGFHLGYIQGLLAGRACCGPLPQGLRGGSPGCCGGQARAASPGCTCRSKPGGIAGRCCGSKAGAGAGCRCNQRVVMQKRIEVNAVRGGPGQIALRIEPRPSCGCNSQKAAAPKSGCKCGKCGGQAAAPRSGCGCGQKAVRQVKSGCGCGRKAAAPKSGCKCGGAKVESVQILERPIRLRLRGQLDSSTLQKVEEIKLLRPGIKLDTGCEKCRSKHLQGATKLSEECLDCLERKLLSDGELSIGVLVPEKPKPKPKARSL